VKLYLKITRPKRAVGVALVARCLSRKCKALSSHSSTIPLTKKIKILLLGAHWNSTPVANAMVGARASGIKFIKELDRINSVVGDTFVNSDS
jgi:hypothetical protein